MSTWTFRNPSKKPHPGKNLSVFMTQNSKAALPPSIGIYINAPVTSGGNCLIIVVLQLWCDVTFVLRLWCYALSALLRRLATAVAHLLYY